MSSRQTEESILDTIDPKTSVFYIFFQIKRFSLFVLDLFRPA